MANYSRLRSLEERRRTRKAVGMIFLTLAVVVLAVIAGFKMLTGLFLFISSINSRSGQPMKDDFIPPSPPQILLPYEATNSAIISIFGYSEPESTVFITRNSEPLTNIKAAENGEFEITDVQLEEGINQFSAVAVDLSGNESQPAKTSTITWLSKPPKLDINSPENNKQFSGRDNFVEIRGMTDPGVKLTVNDRLVILMGAGQFSYRAGLASGENKFVIKAVDQAGNESQKEISVNFSP